MKMNLFESNFINKCRYLSQKKRSFLLDTMEQTRQTYRKIKRNPLYQKYTPRYQSASTSEFYKRQMKEASLVIQMGSVAIWMLLDDPQKRDIQGIELRLREIDRLVMYHGIQDMYEAVKKQISGTIWNETYSLSGENVPKHKQKEYEEIIKEYIRLNNTEHKRFIGKIKYSQQRCGYILPLQVIRQREG